MNHEDRLKYLVHKFFTDLKIESKYLSALKYVVKKKIPCIQFGREWKVILKGKKGGRIVKRFKEKPTEDYLRRMQEESKAEQMQKCLERLREHAANIKAGAPRQPARLAIMKQEPKCKYCGNEKWIKKIDCYTCANTKCARTRTIVHQGEEMRNIMSRNLEGDDPSQHNGFVRNVDVTENNSTVVRCAPATARSKKKKKTPVGPRVIQQLEATNRRVNPPVKTDTQIVNATKKMQEACCKMELNPVIAKKALMMFKAFVKNNEKLPREEETIAACLFNCLPPPRPPSAGASSAFSAAASSVGASSAGASSAGASSAGASAGASRKRTRSVPRCETPEYLLLKQMTDQFFKSETKKKKRRNTL